MHQNVGGPILIYSTGLKLHFSTSHCSRASVWSATCVRKGTSLCPSWHQCNKSKCHRDKFRLFKIYCLLKVPFHICHIHPCAESFIHWWQRRLSMVLLTHWERYHLVTPSNSMFCPEDTSTDKVLRLGIEPPILLSLENYLTIPRRHIVPIMRQQNTLALRASLMF